jgi:hypothetical protein
VYTGTDAQKDKLKRSFDRKIEYMKKIGGPIWSACLFPLPLHDDSVESQWLTKPLQSRFCRRRVRSRLRRQVRRTRFRADQRGPFPGTRGPTPAVRRDGFLLVHLVVEGYRVPGDGLRGRGDGLYEADEAFPREEEGTCPFAHDLMDPIKPAELEST